MTTDVQVSTAESARAQFMAYLDGNVSQVCFHVALRANALNIPILEAMAIAADYFVSVAGNLRSSFATPRQVRDAILARADDEMHTRMLMTETGGRA
ncbi:hypothetical protein [Methylovirgula sp. 4M-Z18]|uniref:hypothetical protein n=1 Tax=Methylovirgula sp. 4M-Z18 TaxID=2293567 RepID=UPI000E2EB28D|nr:hypothetical protein [Methylovirgula sp. 4M-Z18]RFB80421.1 hypothetical protein DYH55_02515 [Methylovirgula sp. 4M-Z18]